MRPTANGGRFDAMSRAPASPGTPPARTHGDRPRRLSRWRGRGGWLLVLLACGLAADAGWLHAKAWLAQALLQHAWTTTRATQQPQRPWPWADTHPVARLRVTGQGVDQIVLAGDAGRSLAFGPGWAEASAAPGGAGTVVISGHRDTHFAFLRALQPGDTVQLEAAGATRSYRVTGARIADSRREAIALPADGASLLLVTCWPFDALTAGGPWRYVVRAEPDWP
jgi:sortase A